MDIFGIGPLEFLFIILVALIVLGPKDMIKAGRTLGAFLRRIVTSQEWRYVQQASREVRHLPNRLIREAGLEEAQKELDEMRSIGGSLRNDLQQWNKDISSWTTPPSQNSSYMQVSPLPGKENNAEDTSFPNEGDQEAKNPPATS